MAKKVMEKLEDEVGEKNLNLSVTENGMEGKLLGRQVASMQQATRSNDGRQCGNAWSVWEYKTKREGRSAR